MVNLVGISSYEKKYFHFDMKVEATLDLKDIDKINSSSGNSTMNMGLDEFLDNPDHAAYGGELFDNTHKTSNTLNS